MVTFKQYLTESFEKPYKYRLNSTKGKVNKKYLYTFESKNGTKYTVYIYTLGNGGSEIHFVKGRPGFSGVKKYSELTGDNDHRVLTTVFMIMFDYIREYEPTDMQITGFTSKRTRVFMKIIRKMAQKHLINGYTITDGWITKDKL